MVFIDYYKFDEDILNQLIIKTCCFHIQTIKIIYLCLKQS